MDSFLIWIGQNISLGIVGIMFTIFMPIFVSMDTKVMSFGKGKQGDKLTDNQHSMKIFLAIILGFLLLFGVGSYVNSLNKKIEYQNEEIRDYKRKKEFGE